MQPARGRFARFDLDRQIASTFPAHWKVGPAPSSHSHRRQHHRYYYDDYVRHHHYHGQLFRF